MKPPDGRSVPTSAVNLIDLLEHPELVTEITPDAARGMLVQLATVQVPLLARALAGQGDTPADRLLTVADAAVKLGQSEHWLYKHAGTLPFTVRNGRALRFSEVGIEKWIRQQQRY